MSSAGRKPKGPGESLGCRQFYAWSVSRDYNYTDIAKELGMPLSTISRYMRGKRPPGRRAAVKIQKLTGIDESAWDVR